MLDFGDALGAEIAVVATRKKTGSGKELSEGLKRVLVENLGPALVEGLKRFIVSEGPQLAARGLGAMESFARSKWNRKAGAAGSLGPGAANAEPSEVEADESEPNDKVFAEICRSAVDCDFCFKSGSLSRGFVALPQPRYVGPGYWSAPTRRLFVMINPGSGEGSEHDRALLTDLESYKSGKIDLAEFFTRQLRCMEHWGGGRFINFFRRIGVSLKETAIINLAWCATATNEYPDHMLNNCFGLHGRRAIYALRPTMIVACGAKAQQLGRASGLPFVPAPHYAALKQIDYEAIAEAIGTAGSPGQDRQDDKGPKQREEPFRRTKRIRLLEEANPKRGKSAARYACYRDGMTVPEYEAAVRERCGALEARKCKADIEWDVRHRFIRLEPSPG
ncbi:hypothetical protein [Roseiarcus sp.]|uniref:hypothetical protein n=1 Tax=Roseiarcus sp. TaxID=1969460 RepID=UPI003F96BE5B